MLSGINLSLWIYFIICNLELFLIWFCSHWKREDTVNILPSPLLVWRFCYFGLKFTKKTIFFFRSWQCLFCKFVRVMVGVIDNNMSTGGENCDLEDTWAGVCAALTATISKLFPSSLLLICPFVYESFKTMFAQTWYFSVFLFNLFCRFWCLAVCCSKIDFSKSIWYPTWETKFVGDLRH